MQKIAGRKKDKSKDTNVKSGNMKTFNWPVVAGIIFCCIFWAGVLWVGFHIEKTPVYSVTVVHDYYIVDQYLTTDTTGIYLTFAGSSEMKLIIHKIQ